jgi:hypothetical protein
MRVLFNGVLALLTSVLARTVVAQPPATPTEVTQAQAALTAGKADSAVAILSAFFERNPGAVAGRLLYGNALKQRGDLDAALLAYERVTAPPAVRVQAQFNAAGIHALKGNADEAFRLLAVVKATGGFDMDLVGTNADFASLQSDPRLASVMFQPADFSPPFVETVRVLHEWVGEGKNDQFGWIARGIGDADGDGVSDVVSSAPTFGATGPANARGKVYVYSGKSGRLLWSYRGAENDRLGTGLEGAGDVNGDGAGDVIAGAPGTGKAYVLSGRDGSVLQTLTGVAAESFGSSASGAGDQDGDGRADVVVGAPANAAKGPGTGRAYVYSGRTGALIRTLEGDTAGVAFGSIVAGDKQGRATPIVVGAPGAGPSRRGRVYTFASGTTTPRHVIESDSSGTALGAMFASVIGDIDNDGVDDVYGSDFVNSAKGPSTGRVYVHSGADGRRLLSLTGETAGSGFGIGSADVGDVNRDGHDDILVGAWQFGGAATSGGKVYLYSGKDGSLLRTITGRVPGETLGFDASGIGDVDGDGTPDFLLTSAWSNVAGFRSGRTWVVSGK